MAGLNKNPQFQQQEQRRNQARRQFEGELRDNEEPLLNELKSAGLSVGSVWDLVNTKKSYLEAIPILGRHLALPYDLRIREGIARALTVPEAKVVAKDILEELKGSKAKEEVEFRWALANALTVVANFSMMEEIKALTKDKSFENVHKILRKTLVKLSDKNSL